MKEGISINTILSIAVALAVAIGGWVLQSVASAQTEQDRRISRVEDEHKGTRELLIELRSDVRWLRQKAESKGNN